MGKKKNKNLKDVAATAYIAPKCPNCGAPKRSIEAPCEYCGPITEKKFQAGSELIDSLRIESPADTKANNGNRVKTTRSCVKPLAVELAKFIIAEGYGLSDMIGIRQELKDVSEDDEEIGVLWGPDDSSTRIHHILGFPIFPKDRRVFLCLIWIKEPVSRGAWEKHWVMEVYGRELLDRARELAEKLSETFNVDITVDLDRNELGEEIFDDEFGM